MGDVINRTTLEYLRSVSTPRYDSADWIINPDMSDVEGWPPQYWKIQGNNVRLMNPAERNNVDQQILDSNKDAIADELLTSELSIIRAFAAVLLQEINELRADHGRPPYTPQQFRDAVKGQL